MALRADEFDYIGQLLKRRSGLTLTPDKEYLLESRLLPIARSQNCAGLPEFITFLKTRATEPVFAEITEAMTTNESLFFRDGKPFDQLRKIILPRMKAGGARKLRIWSAACSTGQEAYSVLMSLMEESFAMNGFHYEIVGTDIAPKVLEKAKNGIYTQFEVQRGLPIALLLKYFKQLPDNNWQIGENLRAQVNFRPFNLLDDFAPLGKFDIIFCRNVLIYFDEATKGKVMDRLAAILNPGGFLFLGSSETILGLSNKLKAFEQERGLFVPA